MNERFVVSADNHARPELIYAIQGHYGDNARQVLLGDLFDGPGSTKAAMQAAVDVGAVMLLGNHEWDFLGAVLDIDGERRYEYATSIWPRTHQNVIESYGGIYPTVPSPMNALRLWDKMPASHRDLLLNADIFIESEDVLLIHAGVTAEPWEFQRNDLKKRQAERQNDYRYAYGCEYVPPQLREPERTTDENVALSGLGKLLVNGHFHRRFTSFENRWSPDKNRLNLATDKRDQFALVWESWSGNLVRVSSEGCLIDTYSQSVSNSLQRTISIA